MIAPTSIHSTRLRTMVRRVDTQPLVVRRMEGNKKIHNNSNSNNRMMQNHRVDTVDGIKAVIETGKSHSQAINKLTPHIGYPICVCEPLFLAKEKGCVRRVERKQTQGTGNINLGLIVCLCDTAYTI
uniref:Uncharacterized protein n=1 Tax=Proboscia inermis TaxID=420281 RepID=A0A7S0CJH0_9STRA|mmetsp:Transcript_52339/g.52724  ORF Transcript_52339/g.52724 Transcript_52339/m.52724 type:complete len:127 (+) Transcript_52339:1-381(+)